MDPSTSPCSSTGLPRSEVVTTAATGETIDVSKRRHLRLVPELVVVAETGDSADSTRSGRGIGSVTYLPTFIPSEEDGELEPEGPIAEEGLAAPVAAVMPVPTL